MTTRLFVRSLSYDIGNTELETIFAAMGSVVSAKVIFDKDTQRSKGFGFVEMSTAEEAKRAIKELNNTEQFGRKIMVLEAENTGRRKSSDDRRY